ncbi:MAG: 3-oxoadipyl-CoA thiolase [Ottowia sp.]|nr:3-oxoadipyl-CoA thiolase [Ottowia sp.]
MTTHTLAWIIDGIRTPFGRYGGALAQCRADDLAAIPISALMTRNPSIDWTTLDDVLLGCANQAGEDNRNIARMAALLAGLAPTVPGVTINRLCGSGVDAVAMAARTLMTGEANLIIAGGVESMTRAPFVMGKSEHAFARSPTLEDTTLGWRFVNPRMLNTYGIDSMPQTAENVASEFHITRTDQDQFALRSQQRYQAAQLRGFFNDEIISVTVPQNKNTSTLFQIDEHPRANSTLQQLSALKPVVHATGTITAGNASGLNDGACALLLASDEAVQRYQLTPRARIVGTAVAGVPPRIMGIGPVPATQKLLTRLGWSLDSIDCIELNEAFAAQSLAVLRQLGIADNTPHVNPNGGAIALGHPLGASGARLILTALRQLEQTKGQRGLITMCIGVGQGIALAIERV